jgi:imidazolonepropionase-like amidohydrolase
VPGASSALLAQRLFTGETLVDQRSWVIVQNGRITAVAFVEPSADLPVTDLGDVTLLPGLIDAHSHLAFDPPADIVEQMTTEDDETVLGRMRAHARQALRAGITTIRDLGDRNYLSLALRQAPDLPEVLAAGPPITTPGGHCWFLGGEATGPAALRTAVSGRVERQVDVIKVMATGGSVTPGSALQDSQYSAAELRLIVEAAHAAGTMVTAHAHGGKGIADAVQAGVDGIEHCTFLTADGPAPDWATIRAIAEAGTFIGVTIGKTPPSPRLDAVRAMYAGMRREGVRLVCSSDAGITARKPHDCLPEILTEFIGFTEASAVDGLKAVTTLAARSCGIAHRKGRIAPGYDADLLAVTGNPAEHPEALLDVRAVFRNGQEIRR